MHNYMSYGLNLGWGGPIADYIGFWGDLLRGILQIQSVAHITRDTFATALAQAVNHDEPPSSNPDDVAKYAR